MKNNYGTQSYNSEIKKRQIDQKIFQKGAPPVGPRFFKNVQITYVTYLKHTLRPAESDSAKKSGRQR